MSQFCVKKNKNCVSESRNGKCVECERGYYLSEVQDCVALSGGCLFANYVNGDCLQCQLGYVLLPLGRCGLGTTTTTSTETSVNVTNMTATTNNNTGTIPTNILNSNVTNLSF